MHELGMAESALRAVLEIARDANVAQVRRIFLRIGVRSGIDTGSFRFALEALRAGSAAQFADIEIERTPASGCCATCGFEFVVLEPGLPTCPRCHDPAITVTGGRELELVRVDIQSP